MSDWLFDDDQNYDGQGKSRAEETNGAMMVAGCLALIGLGFAIAVLTAILVWIIL